MSDVCIGTFVTIASKDAEKEEEEGLSLLQKHQRRAGQPFFRCAISQKVLGVVGGGGLTSIGEERRRRRSDKAF